MTEQEAKDKAKTLLDALVSSGCIEVDSDGYRIITDSYATELISDALLSAHRVPEGCVRLPDGRDVKVLGTLPMTADGCVVVMPAVVYHPSSSYDLHVSSFDGLFGDESVGRLDYGIAEDCEWIAFRSYRENDTGYSEFDCFELRSCYSTRAAAEAARREGGGE